MVLSKDEKFLIIGTEALFIKGIVENCFFWA